jgi:hypothetical protein
MVSMTKLLPLVTQLGNYLKMGADHYSDLRSAGKEAGPEVIAMYLRLKLDSWDPKLNNKSLLDDETKDAASRFLAGVACNFAGA